MRIAIAKEIEVGERRVALVPDTVSRLVKQGLEVWVETGAGERAYFDDAAYADSGAQIIKSKEQLWGEADIVLKVNPPGLTEEGNSELDILKSGSILISFLNPLGKPEIALKLAERGVTGLSMEMIPRITRSQSMDALSSQASIAGYKAVLVAAAMLPKYFPMLTTAAGTVPPAKVLVIGAGVAGLQAIATARRLGAVVEAFDVRPVVKEQVQSLGAKFIDIQIDENTDAGGGYAKQVGESTQETIRQAIAPHVKSADVVITTAQIPGKPAPLMICEQTVMGMKPGAVIVDLAAENGGNCALTEKGRDVVKYGITIIAPTNLPASTPIHASQLYSKNLASLLQLLIKDQQLNLDFSDEIINAICITHAGEIRSDRIRNLLTVKQV